MRQRNIDFQTFQRIAAQRLAIWIGVIALLSASPIALVARIDTIPKWVYLVALVALIQIALAVYLWQTADWSSLWIATLWCTVATIGYTALFAWLSQATADHLVLAQFELATYLRGGRLAAWSFLMLCLNGFWSYVAGKRAARWKSNV